MLSYVKRNVAGFGGGVAANPGRVGRKGGAIPHINGQSPKIDDSANVWSITEVFAETDHNR